MGRGAPRLAVHGPRRRRVLVGQGLRAEGRCSSAARCRTRSASPTRATGAPSSPQAGDGAKLPIVVFPDGTVLVDPSNAEIASAAGSPGEPGADGIRPRDRRRRAGGPVGGRLRRLGGIQHVGRRRRRDRGQATSSSLIRNYLGFPAGSAAAVWLSRPTSRRGSSGRTSRSCRAVTELRREDDGLVRHPLRQRPGARPRGAPGDGRQLSPPRRSRARGAERRRRLLRRPDLRGARDGRPATSTSSAARTRLDRLRSTSPATRAASRSSSGPSRSARGCRTTWCARWRRRRSSRSVSGPRSSAVGATGGWSTSCSVIARTGSEETVERRRALPHDRSAPAHRLAAAGGRQGFAGLRPHGTDLRDDHAWPLDRSPFLLETSMPGVFAAGDVRHGSVEARGIRSWRGLGRDSAPPPSLRGRPAAATRPSEGARAAVWCCVELSGEKPVVGVDISWFRPRRAGYIGVDAARPPRSRVAQLDPVERATAIPTVRVLYLGPCENQSGCPSCPRWRRSGASSSRRSRAADRVGRGPRRALDAAGAPGGGRAGAGRPHGSRRSSAAASTCCCGWRAAGRWRCTCG